MGALIADPALATEPHLYIDRPAVSPRTLTATMIICGDCGGDAPLPRKTVLTAEGCCYACGGRSYVLAAELEIARRVALALNKHSTTLIT